MAITGPSLPGAGNVTMREVLNITRTSLNSSSATHFNNSSVELDGGESAKLKLLEANDEVALELLPVMLFLGLLSILGVVGNGFVCLFFTRKSSSSYQDLLIVLLAVFDLHTCILTIPYEIIDLRFYVYYIFDTDVICKVFKFVNTFCNAGSILVLLVIAVDRYRKVCKPLKSQFQLQSIRITFIIIFVTSACYSIPIFFLYGYRTVQSNIIHGAKSRDCSTPDGVNTLYPTLFHGVLFLTFAIISAALVIMYSKILAEVKRRNKHEKRNRPDKISYGDTNNISQGTDDDQTLGVKTATPEITILNARSPKNCVDVTILGATNLGNVENEKENLIRDQKQHFISREALAEFDRNHNKTLSKDLPGIASCASNIQYLSPGLLAADTNEPSLDSRVSVSRSVSDVTPEMPAKMAWTSQGAGAEKTTSQAGVMRSRCDPHPRKKTMVILQVPSSGLMHTYVTDYVSEQTIAQAGKRSASSRKRRRARQQTTLVAFSVTTFFILSFLPHLTLMIAKLVIFPGFDLGLKGAAFVVYNVFLRSYFVNCMCNPFIYGILNAQFRLEVQRILRRICCSEPK